MKKVIKFKTFDLNTLKGIESAERYQAKGWVFHSFGFNLLTLSKSCKQWKS